MLNNSFFLNFVLISMFDTISFALINGVISSLSALIIYILLEKRAQKLIETYKKDIKNEAERWLNSETGQKAIYSIGAIIGNGAKAGIGITTRGGKFKIENLIGEIFGRYAQEKILPKFIENSSSNEKRQSSSSNNLNIQ